MIEADIPGFSQPTVKSQKLQSQKSQSQKLSQEQVLVTQSQNPKTNSISPKKLESDHLPKVSRLGNDFLARFIKGPWLDENQPTKSREEKKSEKKLFKRLVKVRAKIADEADLKPTLVAGDEDLTLLSIVRIGMFNLFKTILLPVFLIKYKEFFKFVQN